MIERNTENVYLHISDLVSKFSNYFPEEGEYISNILHEVHDIPEIGDAIYKEEKLDIEEMISIVKSKNNLSPDESAVLNEAQTVLCDLNKLIEYKKHENRILPKHPCADNFEHLRQMCDDASYQHCLVFAKKKINKLFEDPLGATPGSKVFHNALDVLSSFYFFCVIMDELNQNDKEIIATLVYDISRNIGHGAGLYLEKKDPKFVEISKSYT